MPTSPPWTRLLACVPLGMGIAVLGLLPWLVTGMRLPGQNLWATDTAPEDMPIALLPFNQYLIVFVVALLVTGYTIAGVVVRSLGSRLPRRAVLPVGAGVLTVHLVAAAQTTHAVASGLNRETEAWVYLVMLVLLILASVVVGLAGLGLISMRSRATALIALSSQALLTTAWVAAFLTSPHDRGFHPPSEAAYFLDQWLPAMLVGGLIAWCGLATLGRVAAAVYALLTLWVFPAVVTGVVSAAGTRLLLRDPAELMDYWIAVTEAALRQPPHLVQQLLVACAVTVAGIALRRSRPSPGRVPAEAVAPAADVDDATRPVGSP